MLAVDADYAPRSPQGYPKVFSLNFFTWTFTSAKIEPNLEELSVERGLIVYDHRLVVPVRMQSIMIQ
jgi:hypothetical protein